MRCEEYFQFWLIPSYSRAIQTLAMLATYYENPVYFFLWRHERQGNPNRCNQCEESVNVRLLRLFQPNGGWGEASAVAYLIQACQDLHHNEAFIS